MDPGNSRRELPGTNKRHLSDEGCDFLREGINSTSETDNSKGIKMNQKEILIREINELPDFMVSRLLEMIRYIKLGIDFEFLAKEDNEFYQSDEFKNIVAESISEYRQGKTLVLDRDPQFL